MTKILLIVSVLTLSILSGCIKNDDVIFRATVAEIDQTTWNANAAGLTYPILTRVPAAGRVVGTTAPNGPDSTLRRLSGIIRVRINLVGPQSGQEQTVGFTTFSSPITTVNFPATLTATQAPPTGQTPAAAAAALPVSDAVAGTHFQALSNTVTIPANSSFGFIEIRILNPGVSAAQARFLGIQLNNTGNIPASTNYSQIGLVIDQR